MKFGITFWPARPKIVVPLAKAADEHGFESLWVGEHIVFPTHIDTAYPYAEVDAPLPSTPLFDPLVLLSHVAAVTRHLKLGTSVFLAPLRHPLNIARMLITLDAVSNGRVMFGVGAGWLRSEVEALGVPFATRGRRTDEILTVLRRLWTEPLIAHEGEFYPFAEVGFEPKPVNGTIPILLGGETDLALKRAAKFGDGWIGVPMSVDEARAVIEKLARLRAEFNPTAQPLEITVGCPTLPTVELVQQYADVGVHRLFLNNALFAPAKRQIEAIAEGIERFASDVIARLR